MPMGIYLDYLLGLPLILRVFLIALIPTLLTVVGALPVLLGLRLKESIIDIGMGFSAGVMLVASFTSLLIPSLKLSSLPMAILGFIGGVLLIRVLDTLIPHVHFIRIETIKARRAWLIALAMIIHNIPEGMAVGAMASYNVVDGLVLALAIGIQDVPEGMAVAIPLLTIGYGASKALGIAVVSGIAELASALIPPLLITYINSLLPIMMALASGAMIYVVIHEIIPDIYGHEHNEQSTLGFFIGFLTMLILDTILS